VKSINYTELRAFLQRKGSFLANRGLRLPALCNATSHQAFRILKMGTSV
jgi:hypothetical protein